MSEHQQTQFRARCRSPVAGRPRRPPATGSAAEFVFKYANDVPATPP